MDREIIIGLETHVELKTKSKIFCSCSAQFGGEPNTNTCPRCLAMPGTLPVLNKQAVEFAMKAALALNCEILPFCVFDRKNYFYPDLPKGFQTSQYTYPLARNGYIDIKVNGKTRRIRINRIHLEDDAGKSIHEKNYSLVDLNRAGVPLIEIVTEPDIRSPEEARLYLEKLKAILEYTEVSDCRMEEGSLRCDANISLRPFGSDKLGTKTEIKNLNSFRSVQRGLEYEVWRQNQALDNGEEIVQETLQWDEDLGVTVPMRSKEEAHDYRYFPEPDLVPTVITEEWIEAVRSTIPELPDSRFKRFVEEYGLPEYDAEVLTASRPVADYYEACLKFCPDPKAVSNWVMVDLFALLKANNMELADCLISPENLGEMIKLIKEGTISSKIAKTVFEEMFKTGKTASTIVEEKGLVQISDEGELRALVERVVAESPKSVEDYKNGKKKALGFMVGQVMKETKGKANPQLVNKLLLEILDN
ncbi:MAG TPA: Asp-tRNA(Asn)/Glu-tRNA(Gln) amidotransferase subunit GatB [Clostridia bacterium]|nr:Asp-tRNA(Asn)/Glu-tRNA(Gln) amidotransferase subunit GatB [Clostridia bacterium]